MTDKEIIKALECCGRESCCGCPYRGNCHQGNPMIRDALALINRQQAEIERLTINMNAFGLSAIREKERADNAVKEFAERLCEDRLSNDPVVIAVKVELKEMVGEGDEIRR